MRTPLALLTLSTLALVAAEPSRPILIQHVRIFDGTRVLAADSVLVQDGKILKVGNALKAPAGASTRDGAGCTLLPGLIDAHVHTYGDALRQSLALGVTTVIDMFTDPSVPREAKAAQDPASADIRSAGILATCPKGHGTEYPVAVATLQRPEEAEAWVQARLGEGSDFIKIVYDDAHLFGFNLPTLDLATVRALIEAAHRHGKLAVVHVSSAQAAREALEAGADGLVHAWVDKGDDAALAALAKARKAFVIPTLSAFTPGHAVGLGSDLAADPHLAPYLGAEAVGNLRARAGKAPGFPGRAAVQALRAAGVPLLAGTDAPNPGTTHGASLSGELELLVGAGLTNLEALQAATRIPAFTFGLADRGAVAPGLRADLVLVEGDPTRDIRATRAVVAVWKAGVPVDRAAFSRAIEARRAEMKQAPAFAAGVVSSFQESLSAREGGDWSPSTDSIAGGASTVTVSRAEGAMRLAGTVDGKLPFAWAGALWTPGGGFDKPRDFTALKELRFRAQGGGTDRFRVMLFTATGGYMPKDVYFTAASGWQDVVIPLDQFQGADLTCVTALVLGAGPKAGPFTLSVTDLRFQ